VTQIDGIHIEEDLMLLAAPSVLTAAATSIPRRDRGRHRECRRNAGAARQPDRARSGPHGLPSSCFQTAADCAAQGKRLHLPRRGVFGCGWKGPTVA
jgi:hypothetical protein